MGGLLSSLVGPVRRRWRARGFGVHSPFAYSYIRSVIHPPRGVRYYAEDTLDSPAERLIYRIGVEAYPARAVTFRAGDVPPPGSPTYMAAGKSDIAAITAWAESTGCGVLFTSPGVAIFCMRPHIPFQRYEVAIPARNIHLPA